MADLPGSEVTLRAALVHGPLPAERAVTVVGQIAQQLAERHRAGEPHGAVGLDTVLVEPGGGARLTDPPPGARSTTSDAYDRDTRALGQLLTTAAGGPAALPPGVRELAHRTTSGGVVTPAAFVAQLSGLVPPPDPGQHPRQHARHRFADASLDDLFGGPALDSGPVLDGGLPPELDPRRPMSRRELRRRQAARRAITGEPPAHRVLIGALLAAALLAALVTAVLLVSRNRSQNDGATRPTGSTSSPAATSGPTGRPGTGTPSAAPTGRRLRIAGVAPYDPEGDGTENAAAAHDAVDGDPATAWTTDRYSTAAFGGLKHGLGLLLDLGRVEVVRTVRVRFGVPGTTVRVYTDTARSGLLTGPAVAARAAAPAAVALRLPSPARARYVLLWLTRLPRSSGGGYRGSVAEVRLTG